MKTVTVTDHRGLRHRYAVPDDLPEKDWPHGLKLDPPKLDELDWEGIRQDIHNALVDLGIATWRDWQKQQHRVQGAILHPILRRLVALLRAAEYQEVEEETTDGL
jgi:hypothetical protein